MKLKYKKLREDAVAPLKKIGIDAGFDLTAVSINKTDNYIEYGTGLAFEIPEGYVGLIFPRSSITKYNLMLKNSIGVIDASYRGEIMCRFTPIINDNIRDIIIHASDRPFQLKLNDENQYKVGERVCQIVFLELPKIDLIEAEELSETERGSGGFGSTGQK